MSDIGIYVGHKPEAVEAVRALVLGILQQPVGDNVRIAALEALPDLLKIQHVNISNNSFNMDRSNQVASRAPQGIRIDEEYY